MYTQEGHPACKKNEWWGTDVVICLQRGADFHVAQLMPLPLTVSCFSKFQTGFTFLVAAHPGSPGQRDVKRVCVCVCMCTHALDQFFTGRMPFMPPNQQCQSTEGCNPIKNIIRKKGKGKIFPYSLPNVGPSDPGVQAVSPQVT